MKKILLLSALVCLFNYAAKSQALTTPYFEDFETGSPGWTTYSLNSATQWELGMPNYMSTSTTHSGNFCWDINLDTAYQNNAESYLISPAFNFTGSIGLRLSFWHNFIAEAYWDGVVLQYTLDTTNTAWITLGSINALGTSNWYTDSLLNSSGLPGWSGVSGGWIQSSIIFPNFSGTGNVWFRFQFTSDASVTAHGHSIDDFSIEETAINVISGSIFSDDNYNGIVDAGDLPFANVPVACNSVNGTLYQTTDANGYYSFIVDSGVSYTVSATNPIYTTISPASFSTSFSGTNQLSGNNDFLLTIIPGVIEVEVDAQSNFVRPGMAHNLNVIYRNNGTAVTSGTISVFYDNSFTFVSCSDPSTPTGPLSLDIPYSNLVPGEQRNASCVFMVDSTLAIGSPTSSVVFITPSTTDTLPLNNRDTLNLNAVNSYDPNDKRVEPMGDLSPQQVQNGIELNYTVNFQNTGTAVAFHVNVYDQIDNDLDLTTFELTGNSHPITSWAIDGNRVLHVSFANINLPDSNANEAGSHGFFKYKISPVTTTPVGSVIDNSAAIYFDNNSPIITNTTSNEIVIPTGIAEENDKNKIFLFPNPNSGNFFIATTAEITKWEIMNSVGQVVATGRSNATDGLIEIQTESLSNGIYLVKLQGPKSILTGTFVKE